MHSSVPPSYCMVIPTTVVHYRYDILYEYSSLHWFGNCRLPTLAALQHMERVTLDGAIVLLSSIRMHTQTRTCTQVLAHTHTRRQPAIWTGELSLRVRIVCDSDTRHMMREMDGIKKNIHADVNTCSPLPVDKQTTQQQIRAIQPYGHIL